MELLNFKSLSEKLNISAQTLRQYKLQGMPYISVPGTDPKYELQAVLEWIKTYQTNDKTIQA